MQKILRKSGIRICLSLTAAFLLLFPLSNTEAAYNIGIVGIGSRTEKTNLLEYTNPANAKNPLDHAQGVFSNFMTTELGFLPDMIAVDRTEQAETARIQEAALQLSLGNQQEAVKLFNTKLDYLIYGYVSNMTVTHRESLATSNLAVRVDLSVRIIDAATGKVVCIASGTGESKDHGGVGREAYILGGEELPVGAWDEALQNALTKIMLKIKKQI